MKTPRHPFAPGMLQQMPARAKPLRVTLAAALWFCAIALGVCAAILWGGV